MTDFSTLFGIVWCLFFCVYGLAAMVSMLVRRENAALLAVIVALIAACLCGYGPSLKQGKEWGVGWIQDASYARWLVEAWFESETFVSVALSNSVFRLYINYCAELSRSLHGSRCFGAVLWIHVRSLCL
jgi:ABC-type multidrug transport system permease subunit